MVFFVHAKSVHSSNTTVSCDSCADKWKDAFLTTPQCAPRYLKPQTLRRPPLRFRALLGAEFRTDAIAQRASRIGASVAGGAAQVDAEPAIGL